MFTYILSILEAALGTLLSPIRGHDSHTLSAHPSLTKDHPIPTITVTSPLGPSPQTLPAQYTHDGTEDLPSLEWRFENPALQAQVREWVIVIEDPDIPLPFSATHGLYYRIPVAKTSVNGTDLGPVEGEKNRLSGGFSYGPNTAGKIWSGPRPVMNHGVHRYFHQVLGVGEGADWATVEGGKTSVGKEEVMRVVEGKVVGWGRWIGLYERKWE